MKTLAEFQELASRTLPAPKSNSFFEVDGLLGSDDEKRNVDLIHAALGLSSEAGELADPIKKAMFYGKPLDVANIREEAGDLLWYIAGPLCRALGCTLEELATENIAKLQKRYPAKYTNEAAIARADKHE